MRTGVSWWKVSLLYLYHVIFPFLLASIPFLTVAAVRWVLRAGR
jgi:hypothetical protein